MKKDKSSNSKIRWCLTEGWGATDYRIEPWHTAKDYDHAAQALGKLAKKKFPRVYTQVWTMTYTETGVVCDFGSHTCFGFIEGAEFPMWETSAQPGQPEPEDTRPQEEVSAPEYLCCKDGKRLSEYYRTYLEECKTAGSGWWMSHALQYCIIQEWFTMFTEEEPSISEIWEHDLAPIDIWDHVRQWASEDPNGAEIFLQDNPDARWDAFHKAFMWRQE